MVLIASGLEMMTSLGATLTKGPKNKKKVLLLDKVHADQNRASYHISRADVSTSPRTLLLLPAGPSTVGI